MDKHPAQTHNDAGTIISLALLEAWPCADNPS